MSELEYDNWEEAPYKPEYNDDLTADDNGEGTQWDRDGVPSTGDSSKFIGWRRKKRV